MEKRSGIDRNVTERDAARLVGVSAMTLLRARRAGLIGYYRVGRRVLYSEAHLRDYLQSVERRARRT
jgi:excisionase family DNA binding protein